MNIILLSGGSGKRLWPLSNDVRSKQFLQLLADKENGHESMVKRVYRQIQAANLDANIVVATSASQKDSIKIQLSHKVDIVVEPERRNTFPAIVLATSYLLTEKKIDPNETVIVLPVDPYVDLEYFETFKKMEQAVQSDQSDIVLMGLQPTYPSSKYGYAVVDEKDRSRIVGFKE
ncbi:MAG: sugar phosphate nucleotidyltransferase, partial [Lachnospiraceae bacterium]|nr:sugar phosphate nucleotidyltransferase [Lachnospiraceae bacterium]